MPTPFQRLSDYVNGHFDMGGKQSILNNATEIERQTRDIQLLLNIRLETNTTLVTSALTTTETTTPSPFREFKTLFGKCNKTKIREFNSFHMTPEPKYTSTRLPKSQQYEG